MKESWATGKYDSARQPTDGFIDSGGVRLHYLDWGGSGPVIILLAGLGDTASIYRGLAPRLAGKWRVLALTRRGHGRSDKPASGFDLDSLVGDILNFMEAMSVRRATFAGASFAGIEMPRLASEHRARVNSLIFLDAHFPRLVPDPDLSDDPTAHGKLHGPSPEDLCSWEAFVGFRKHARPNLARIWSEALEADLREKVTINPDLSVVYNQDKELMDRIVQETWSRRDPAYHKIEAPVLVVVPGGDYHPGVRIDANVAQRRVADDYWTNKISPWTMQRTEIFKRMVPRAQILELDSSEHRIFIAREEETAQAILEFLEDHEF